jgi:glycosyltransferase involved in cell wall biosynthesis
LDNQNSTVVIKMEQNIFVSVLITCWNREKYISEAIESVLASSYTNFECIISDDCSTDDTYNIACKLAMTDKRIKLYRNERQLGDFPNRDKAASYASGSLLKYLDSDDVIRPDGLQKMVEAMVQFPEAAIGLCQVETEINKEATYPVIIKPERAYQEHFYGFGTLRYGPSGAIIRRDVFNKHGGFGINRFVGDTELWLKIVALYPMVKIEPDLVLWRRHDSQEFNLGMKTDMYIRKAYQIYLNALQSDSCPLSEIDVKKIRQRLKWKHARDILSIAFRKNKFGMALQLFREADFGVNQLIRGFKPYRAVKDKFIKTP